jgi:uncharacterized protein with PIN domain
VILRGDGIDACAIELTQRLSLDWNHDPLSRCTLCNTRLELADRRLLDALPPRVREHASPVNACPQCGRLYWEGSHVRRMHRRLEHFARQGADRE